MIQLKHHSMHSEYSQVRNGPLINNHCCTIIILSLIKFMPCRTNDSCLADVVSIVIDALYW
jgi:hypothetical protein